jgi:L-ascorbate metabolism protein UlaG (beta-lactamase superfamily)
MRLTLLGHAAFYIETAGLRVVTDPYSPVIGYHPVDMEADFVTISHENPNWHSCLDHINGAYELIDGLSVCGCVVDRGSIAFGAVQVFENLPDDGPNSMVWFESEGLRVLHMGDCGHLPTAEQIEACGDVQVLLALAGGKPTLSLPDLVSFVEKLKPKAVIPMHFGVPGLQMEAQPLSDLVELWPWPVVQHRGSTVDTAQIEFGTEPVLHTIAPLRQKSF